MVETLLIVPKFHQVSFIHPFSVVRSNQIFGIFKKKFQKSNDVVKQFFTLNNYFKVKNEHGNSIDKTTS